MRKIAICFLLLAGMVTTQANDMDAMKFFNLGLSSAMTPTKIKYFSQALKLNPGLVDAYEKRGVLYFFQEKLKFTRKLNFVYKFSLFDLSQCGKFIFPVLYCQKAVNFFVKN